MYKIGVSFEKICEALSEIKYLFDRKLRILKIGYDRKMKKAEFQEELTNCM